MKLLFVVASLILSYAGVQAGSQRPFSEVAEEGLLTASEALSLSCTSQYTEQFRQTLTDQLAIVKQQVGQGSFCVGVTDLLLNAAYVNIASSGTDVTLSFGVDLLSRNTDKVSDVQMCSIQVSGTLADFANWKQPIISDIYQCPTLTFTSTQFGQKGAEWICAA